MREFSIKPNHSLSRDGTMKVIWVTVLVLGLFALRFAMMGFWLVIPFLVIDFLAVAVAFYSIRKKCSVYESVKIDSQQLQIFHHEAKRSKSWAFDLHWVKLDLQQHEHPWQPSRLLVGSHGKWIEFAGFLTNEERASLSLELKHAINEQRHHA
ncbi:MAG: DUF2244 domain-containing protein [Arenicellales bacterium]